MTGTGWTNLAPEDDWPRFSLRTDRPHPARVYDYLLGGKDNYAADRAAGDEALRVNPDGRTPVRQNRSFLRRVVRYLAAEAGVRQFLDIGTGLPTSPNVHEVAQAAVPEARVVYADNDPTVLAHARALLTSGPEGKTDYVHADLRDPDSILAAPRLLETIDLRRPVALLLIAILHFIPDEDGPYDIVARLLDALPAGSYLALSHLTGDFDPGMLDGVVQAYARNGMVMRVRSRPEVERFFTGLDLVAPGVESLPRWRPDTGAGQQPPPADARVSCYAALARKP